MKEFNEKDFDQLINDILKEEAVPNHHFEEKLSDKIDQWAHQELRQKQKRKTRWWSSIAAATIIGISVLTLISSPNSHQLSDTYKDPKEAALVAQKTIHLINAKLNKGMQSYYDTKKEINKTNQLINNIFNKEKNHEN